MRNAGASIDPPTDPSAAAPPVVSPHRHPVRPGVASLPKGVSADIFGEITPPPIAAARIAPESSLPPPPQPVEPWPVADKTIREEPPVVYIGPEPLPQGRTLRNALIVLFTLLLLAYLVPGVSMAGRIPPGTTVLGVDIGGQRVAEARATLGDRLYAQTHAPIIVRQGMRRLTVDPQHAGLSLDVDATVSRASSAFPSPAQVWTALTGSREIGPVVSVDRVKLDATIADEVAAALDNPGHEGGVTFHGLTPVPTYPQVDRKIDRAAVANAIQKAYLSPDTIVPVAVVRTAPQVTRSEVRHAVEWARRAVAAPVTVTTGTASAQIDPATLAANLTFVPEGHRLRHEFDAEAVAADLERRLIDPAETARDAAFVVKDGKPALVHAAPGKTIDTGRLATDLLAALDGESRTVTATVTSGPPRVGDDDALRMGVKEEVGRYTTSFACCVQRTANIATAARLVDDHLVKPGETFSLNRFLGRRDGAAGFSGAGPTMVRGQAGLDVPGMSQYGTAMLNAVVRAGLEVVEYTPPDVHTQQLPAGLEAAVSYPGPDLVWKNDSPYGVLVQASVKGSSLTFRLWSTKRFDVELGDPVKTEHDRLPAVRGGGACVPQAGQAGFTAEVTRVLKQNGEMVDRQSFRAVYQPRAAVVCPSSGG
ncbi:VanW family protein [Microbispora sp. NPDC049125]|uniref:VanW family protein n=1 Tax=Microbispora sp. NPDC049125 TaxID=3154929 RepID=UPI0034666858